jgi:hypothetical protein
VVAQAGQSIHVRDKFADASELLGLHVLYMFAPWVPAVAHPRTEELFAITLLARVVLATGIVVSMLVFALTAKDPGTFCYYEEKVATFAPLLSALELAVLALLVLMIAMTTQTA